MFPQWLRITEWVSGGGIISSTQEKRELRLREDKWLWLFQENVAKELKMQK